MHALLGKLHITTTNFFLKAMIAVNNFNNHNNMIGREEMMILMRGIPYVFSDTLDSHVLLLELFLFFT